MTVFTLFVQVGRIAQITHGDGEGKLVAILDILDQNRVLIDGPGIKRREQNLKHLDLTHQVLADVKSTSTTDEWKKAWEKGQVDSTFAKSHAAKKQQRRALRRGLNDFQRFQVESLKSKRNKIYNAEFKEVSEKHQAAEKKRLEPHVAKLAKIEKSKKHELTKNFKKTL